MTPLKYDHMDWSSNTGIASSAGHINMCQVKKKWARERLCFGNANVVVCHSN